MRLIGVLLLLALGPASQAMAAPLVGGPDGQPLHRLTGDLDERRPEVVLPAGTSATALAPDGRRFAALTPRRIVILDRRSGRRITGLPSRGATALWWTSANRLLTHTFDRNGREALRSVNTTTGRLKGTTEIAEPLDETVVGRRLRMIVRTATGFRVDDYGPTARRRSSFRIPTPVATDPSFASASLSGRTVLMSYTTGTIEPYRHEVVAPDGQSHPLDLAGTVYTFVTPDLVTDGNGHLARIDRSSWTVRKEVDIPAASWVTAFRGGAIVGLARAVYDHELTQVEDHPDAPAAAGQPLVHGGRIYAQTINCTPSGPANAVFGVDVASGAVAVCRGGRFAIGLLGGAISLPGEDGCD